MGGLLHLVQRGEASVGCGPTHSPPLGTKCNTVSLYDGPLLRGFNVAIKGLTKLASGAQRYPLETSLRRLPSKKSPGGNPRQDT